MAFQIQRRGWWRATLSILMCRAISEAFTGTIGVCVCVYELARLSLYMYFVVNIDVSCYLGGFHGDNRCVRVCVWIRAFVCVYVLRCQHWRVVLSRGLSRGQHVCVCLNSHLCLCTCTCACICVCMYVYTYMPMHGMFPVQMCGLGWGAQVRFVYDIFV